MPDCLTIQDVANEMGVEYKTVYRLVTSGKLPSFRVGRVYRIRRQDLDRYIEEQIYGGDVRTVPDEKLICSVCGATIPSVDLVGGFCQYPGCDEPICATCWGRGIRYCRAHQPSPEDKLARARADLSAGKVDRVVTALQARQREKAFISRFEKRIMGIAALQHPLTGELLKVDDWEPFHETSDESSRLLQALGVAFLERSILAVTPVNERSFFVIKSGDLGRKRPKQGIVIEAQAISDIEAMTSAGYVTRPTSLSELMGHLEVREKEAHQLNAFYAVALGATAGWDEESIRYISASPQGTSYQHRLLAPLLVDLHQAQLHYNVLDQRLQGFVDLFRLADEAEEVLRIKQWIEETIVNDFRSGITLQEVSTTLDVPISLTLQAFQQLAAQPGFRQMTDDEVGPMLIVTD